MRSSFDEFLIRLFPEEWRNLMCYKIQWPPARPSAPNRRLQLLRSFMFSSWCKLQPQRLITHINCGGFPCPLASMRSGIPSQLAALAGKLLSLRLLQRDAAETLNQPCLSRPCCLPELEGLAINDNMQIIESLIFNQILI